MTFNTKVPDDLLDVVEGRTYSLVKRSGPDNVYDMEILSEDGIMLSQIGMTILDEEREAADNLAEQWAARMFRQYLWEH